MCSKSTRPPPRQAPSSPRGSACPAPRPPPALPRSGTVFVSVKDADKARILPAVRLLASLGFKCIATSGTQRYLAEQGVETAKIFKVLEGRPHIVDAIKNGGGQLGFNTTEGAAALAA